MRPARGRRFRFGPAACVVAAAVAVSAAASAAAGAFVGGVERFDGTTKDPLTWDEYNPAGLNNTITQDGAINFSFRPSERWPGAVRSDYTARSVTVGVGQGASVDVRVVKDYTDVLVQPWFALTDNTGGPLFHLSEDDNYISMAAVKWANLVGTVRGLNGSGTNLNTIPGVPMGAGEQYTFQIERPDLNTARFSVFDGVHNLIGSATADVTGLPATLYPAFGVGGVGIREGQDYSFNFDNVTVVPEPASSAAILLTGVAVLFRRRARATQQGRTHQEGSASIGTGRRELY